VTGFRPGPGPAAPAVRAVGYAYPWDFVGDPAAAGRAAELGVDAVAVAAAYHTVRAGSPLHPARRIAEAPHAACYVPVREAVWRGRRLRPARPGWPPLPDAFGHARDAVRAAGPAVYAWTVLTHNSLLAGARPELAVRNAFGEVYGYALCPSAEEVADYCALLTSEVVRGGEPDGLVVEACGPLGAVHGGHHDKTGLAGWTPGQLRLLSLCFCAACARRQRAAGLDPVALAAAVRAALASDAPPGTGTGAPDDAPGSAPGAALGEAEAAALAAVRADVTRELRVRVAEAAREAGGPGLRLTLHASADPWATGAFATVAGGLGTGFDALVAPCWDPGPGGAAELRALRASAEERSGATGEPRARVGGYLLADPAGWGPDAAARDARLDGYLAAGLEEAHLYHLGLVGRAGLALMRDWLDRARAARP
jgi:hypothetical protein